MRWQNKKMLEWKLLRRGLRIMKMEGLRKERVEQNLINNFFPTEWL